MFIFHKENSTLSEQFSMFKVFQNISRALKLKIHKNTRIIIIVHKPIK